MPTDMSYRAPVATCSPKPILKHGFSSGVSSGASTPTCRAQEKHAHFPPPSEEARRYSGVEYDRTPIVVIANELAMPARGCPGRTFEIDDMDAYKSRHHHHHSKKPHLNGAKPSSSGNHVHPNFFATTTTTTTGVAPQQQQQQHVLLDREYYNRSPLALDSTSSAPSDYIKGVTPRDDNERRRAVMMPPLIHADTSESEEDVVSPPLDGEGIQPYPYLSKPASTKRLKKTSHHHGENKFNRTSDLTPTSSLASCPGVDSCLGGF